MHTSNSHKIDKSNKTVDLNPLMLSDILYVRRHCVTLSSDVTNESEKCANRKIFLFAKTLK